MAEVLETEVATGVLVGPLFTDRSPEELAKNLVRLLRTLGIRSSEIRKMSVNEKIGYAKIWLKEEEKEEWVVRRLGNAKTSMWLSMYYDLVHLIEDPMELVVEPLRQEVITEAWPVDTTAKGDHNVLFLSKTTLADMEATSSTDIEEQTNNGNQSPTPPETSSTPPPSVRHRQEAGQAGGETTVEAILDLHNPGSSVDLAKVEQVSTKTSTPFVVPCDCPETVFYHQLQHVGSETRHAEFKRGGIIHDQRSFKDMIARYVCGFLNSEGGTIYFGVNDEGMVMGVRIDDELKRHLIRDIAYAVSHLEPVPPESEYSVNFASVMGASGEIIADLRVLEVCVKPREASSGRHTYKNNIYIRRDGSLQTLNRARMSMTT